MMKHCKTCCLNINDTMGIWNCPVCGSQLQEGYDGRLRDIELSFLSGDN